MTEENFGGKIHCGLRRLLYQRRPELGLQWAQVPRARHGRASARLEREARPSRRQRPSPPYMAGTVAGGEGVR